MREEKKLETTMRYAGPVSDEDSQKKQKRFETFEEKVTLSNGGEREIRTLGCF
ncbi:MAG: hypothetical protein M0Q48_04720 [Verrucomicrobia bacterium]|nr:hypothetical protein [Verrucomicrobiota bacterium]